MGIATQHGGSNLPEVAHQIGKELLRDSEGLGTSGLGIGRMQKNADACTIKLQMMVDGEGGDTATAYRPEAKQGQKQSVAILPLTLPATANRERERRIHKLNTEVGRLQRRNETIESILRPRAGGEARFDRF